MDERELQLKIERHFPSVTIDKRRLPQSRLTSQGVPGYVAEWVLDNVIPGHGSITDAEAAKIRSWAQRLIPRTADAQIVKHRLSEGETIKILTPVQVELTFKNKQWNQTATLPLLDLREVDIPNSIVKKHPDLLRQGMWGVAEIVTTGDGNVILSFQPMQATVDLTLYKEARKNFSLHEWRNLMLTSMGYSPGYFSEEEITLLLCRLLPLVQRSMHQVELAPKATGKSYLYENLSPQIRLVSGGNVTPAVLFVNNQSGQWGLLARFKAVVLDEVQTLNFSAPDEIIGGLKGFLANSQLTRGGLHQAASDCSFVMLANIKLDRDQNPVYRRFLLEELPGFLHETAFLDRLKGILPGWELPKLAPQAYADGTGLKADYFGDILVSLREDLSFDQATDNLVEWYGEREYSRNTNSVRSIASGLMKIQFPDGDVDRDSFERYCLRPAVRMRSLVWDQLQQLDSEYSQYSTSLQYRVNRATSKLPS